METYSEPMEVEQDVELTSSWTVGIDRAVLRCASRTCIVMFFSAILKSGAKGYGQKIRIHLLQLVGPRGAVSTGGVSVAKSEALNLRSIPLSYPTIDR